MYFTHLFISLINRVSLINSMFNLLLFKYINLFFEKLTDTFLN